MCWGGMGHSEGKDFNDHLPGTDSSFLSLDAEVQAGAAQSPWQPSLYPWMQKKSEKTPV